MGSRGGGPFRLLAYAPAVSADSWAIFVGMRLDNGTAAGVPVSAVALSLPDDGLEVRAFPFSAGVRPMPPPGGIWAMSAPRFLSEDIDRDAPDAPRAIGVDPADDRTLDNFCTELPAASTVIRWAEFRLAVPVDSLTMTRRRVRGELVLLIAGERHAAAVSVRVESRRSLAKRMGRIGAAVVFDVSDAFAGLEGLEATSGSSTPRGRHRRR